MLSRSKFKKLDCSVTATVVHLQYYEMEFHSYDHFDVDVNPQALIILDVTLASIG
jgi:hypothetical protein